MSLFKYWAIPMLAGEGYNLMKQREYLQSFRPSEHLTRQQTKDVIQDIFDRFPKIKREYDQASDRKKDDIIEYIMYKFDLHHRAKLGLDRA